MKSSACFELFGTKHAAFVTTVLQISMMIAEVATYLALETRGYFLSPVAFRAVVFPMATIYTLGAIVAMLGVYLEKPLLVGVQSTITASVMVVTDILAIGIICIMAIGKKSHFCEQLPGQFVNEKKFYSALGPFWMYLGAICLHITVAVNMAFLQPLNDFGKQYGKIHPKHSTEINFHSEDGQKL